MASSPIDFNGVQLRDPEDFDTLRSNIFDGVKEEVAASFPKSYGGIRLEVADLDYEGPDTWDFAAQRKALLNDDFVARKLRGTVRLFDENTGELLEERRQSLMRVPWLTERGTFIHKGNEYSTINQNRLVPGPYTRRTENGLLETHFNPRPGSGRGFRLAFDPETAQYRLGVQSSQLHLYSLLKDLGHSDEDLAERWGEDVLRANSEKYDARVLPRAYKRLVPTWLQEKDASRDAMAEAVSGALAQTEVNRSVAERTLPGWFSRQKAASMAAKTAGNVAARILFEKAAAQLDFSPDFRPSELYGLRLDDHIEARSEWKLMQTKQATVAVDLDGTLAKHDGGDFDPKKIGEPEPKMLEKVKGYLEDGIKVVLFTARATDEKNLPPIKKWLKKHGLEDLEITNKKTPDIEVIFDDRARQVIDGEVVKAADTIEGYGSTEDGRSTDLVNWAPDEEGFEVQAPGKDPMRVRVHRAPEGNDRAYMLYGSEDDAEGNPVFSDENHLGYASLGDVDHDMSEVTALYTSPDHRQKGVAKLLLQLLGQLEGDRHLLAQADPFADKQVAKDIIEQIYLSQGYVPVTGSDGQEFLLRPGGRTKEAWDKENPVYDWDGTLIPQLQGGAKAYMDELAELEELTSLAQSLEGRQIDLATARPPMFHKAIREAAARLGMDIGDIHHTGEDKTETIRELQRPLIDNDEQVVSQLHANLGEDSAELFKEASEIPNVKIGERTETFWVCPHCDEEIHEKHSYVRDAKDLFKAGQIDRPLIHVHRGCGGEFLPPPATPEELAWLEGLKMARTLPPMALEGQFEVDWLKEAKITPRSLAAARAFTGEPKSHAQAEAGNYPKGTLWWNGLRIKLENAKGSIRKGLNPDGTVSWRCKMHCDYGYISGTRGIDGDEFDVFIGPHLDSEIVYIIDQVDQKTEDFDEHKAMLGCRTQEQAKELYLKNFEDGWKVGKIRSMTFPQFKVWLRKGKKVKPVAEEKTVKMASTVAIDHEGFDPDLDAEAMQEAYDAVYGHSKPQLASQTSWPAKWMPPGTDQLGWINWYQNYLSGVRSDDDERQIKRWKAFKARHGGAFKKNPTPRRAFALRYWAIDPLQLLPEDQREAFSDRMEDYRAKETERWMRNKTASLTLPDLKLLAEFLNTHHGAGLPLEGTQAQLEDAIAVFLGADDSEASALMNAADAAEKMAAEDRGCLMAMFPVTDATKVVSWSQENIPEANLADDGLERSTHITVLYGFLPGVSFKEVKPLLPEKPLKLRLGRIRRFEANDQRPDSDVLVVEVDSEDFVDFNSHLREELGDKIKVTYPDYKPHLTLAYVKPGTCKGLDGHANFDGQIYICDTLVFSSAGKKRKMTLKIA